MASDFAYLQAGSNQSRANTNVIEISLACLKQGSNLATGDPIHCTSCGSILSIHSILIKTDQNRFWDCEFCGSRTEIFAEDEELPAASELTYVLESAAEVANLSQGNHDSTILIFCIDISGSMCVTKPVAGILNLKTNKQSDLRKLLQPGEEEQFLPGANRNLTYVSRLECVQAAIESQLQALCSLSPHLKVGIIAFNSEIRIIGDGSHEEILAGDKLDDFEGLQLFCRERTGQFVSREIRETSQVLKEKVLGLEETGPTALGPALLVSLLIASEGGAGSKVIICTDGLANIGLGSLDPGCTTEFYSAVGSLATEKGVSVSVISIEGDECRLDALMSVTEISGGNVVRVAPENLSEEFANILSEDVIATHVEVKVTLHRAVEFTNEDPAVLALQNSRLQKKVGNATNHSSFSFNYKLKDEGQLARIGVDVGSLKIIPMQAVFTYKSLEGMRCMRVISKVQEATFDKQKASKNVKVAMLARCGRRQVAMCAEQRNYSDVKPSSEEWALLLREQEIKKEEELADIMEFEHDLEELNQEVYHQESIDRKIEREQAEIERQYYNMEMNEEVKLEGIEPCCASNERKPEIQSRSKVSGDRLVSKFNQLKKKK